MLLGRGMFDGRRLLWREGVQRAGRLLYPGWLADLVYSGVPASWIGRQQEIEIGHMSGGSNVVFYLESRGLGHSPEIVEAVLAEAKKSQRLLREDEVVEIVKAVERTSAGAPRG